MKNKNLLLKLLIFFVFIPAVIISGIFIFNDKKYIWIALCVAISACVPFFINFESKKQRSRNVVIISVMVCLSIIGRYAFSFLPHFKPITAIVVITGIYLGAEPGFLCGAMSALLSNFIFGQGPWTPFQMFAWGLIGLIASFLSPLIKKSKIALCVFGAFSGVFYSLVLDVASTLWYDGIFNAERYLALMVSALPVTAVYAASNIIFLLLLSKPIGQKLERIKLKYGL